jgi:uncharacterized protein (TIRG00374 family)
LENKEGTNRISQNRSTIISLLIILMIIIIGFVLLVYFMRDQVWLPLMEMSIWSLLSILGLTILTTVCYTVMVYWLIRCSGYPVTLWKSFLVLSTSLSANYVTPVKIGIPLRVYLYNQIIGVPVATGTALISAEAVVGILIPAVIAALGIVVLFPSVGVMPTLVLIGLLFLGLAFVLYGKLDRIEQLFIKLPGSRIFHKVWQFIKNVQLAMRSLSLTAFMGLILLDFIMIALQALRLLVVVNIFVDSPNLFVILAVFTISLTAGNLSLIPMGIGVRDASFTLLMMQVGISKEISISIAAIQRLFSPGWPLILGLISANILGVKQLFKHTSAVDKP